MARGEIVWLATSSAEIARARSVLAGLTQAGVLDELGFLVLQTAFADRFYPAVNTIMTRARYLIFVPAIYRYLEGSSHARGRNVDNLARDLQLALRDALLVTSAEGGVIGKDSGRDIMRPPANVYWNALAELGIAAQRLPESVYQDRLSKGLVGPRSTVDDDGAVHPDELASLWDPAFRTERVLTDGRFPNETTFDLTVREARELQRRYAGLRAPDEPTLLTWLVEYGESRGELPSELAGPWDAPAPRSKELGRALEHARRLSLFARGVVLQYQRLLIEKRGDEDPGIAAAFDAWFGRARSELSAWAVPDFLSLAARYRGLRGGDRAFIEAWLACLRGARTARALLENTDARTLVAGRELTMRGPKARLRSRYHLKTWSPPTPQSLRDPRSTFHLYYRHGTGLRFAHDIVDGHTRRHSG